VSLSTAVARSDAALPLNPYDLAGGQQVFWSSFPQDTPQQRAELFARMQAKGTPLSEMIGKRIQVQHVIAHGVEIADEKTGEITEQPRIVLVTPDGTSYQCVSWGILKSLKTLVQMIGTNPPFDPPLELEVQQINTRRGFRTFQLSPVLAETAAPKSGRR
jgi:hypothetical protein